MKKILTTILVASLSNFIYAQNVGIGTVTPQTNLHVYSAADNSIIRSEILGGASSNEASLELKSGPNLYDFLEIRKWRTGASGSIAGINLAGLTQMTTGVGSTAGLLIGTKPAFPIYFTTSNTERMRIASNGYIGIGTTTPQYTLHVENSTADGIAGYFQDNVGTANSRALKTSGKVQFTGLGEAAGNVLTSDGSGNAIWQSLTGSHNHFGEIWKDAGDAGLTLNNTSSAAGAAGFVASASGGGANASYGVQGLVNSSNGIGVFGIASSGGSFAGAIGNTGVAGGSGSGTGVYGASVTGNCIYGFKTNAPAFQGTVGLFYNASVTNTSPVVQIINAASNAAPTSLELTNGFIKVSGTNRMAFTVTATVSNSSNHILYLSYINQAATDIVLATHNYNPGGVGGTYLTTPFGVYWTGTQWAIYIENGTPILNQGFNVMVIKQ